MLIEYLLIMFGLIIVAQLCIIKRQDSLDSDLIDILEKTNQNKIMINKINDSL